MELTAVEVGIINIAITIVVIIEAIAMFFTLKVYSLKYLILLIICSMASLITILGVIFTLIPITVPYINIKLLACITWVIYTNSYLFFLIRYYKDLLQTWQLRICYFINLINCIDQVIFSLFYSFNLGVDASTTGLVLEISGNINATSTIVSETVITFCIFALIFKLSKNTMDISMKLLLFKVLLTMVFMWLFDIIVLILDYGGNGTQIFSFITKPMLLSFKFFIELLILGHVKKHLFMLSGLNNW
jgi:hypothetical protein